MQLETPPKPRAEIVRARITRLPEVNYWRHLIRSFLRALARFVVWLFLDVHTSGLEHIPDQGSTLMVFNHLGDADVILALSKTQRDMEFMAKSEFYDLPFLGRILDAYGVIWVHRGHPDRNALRAALKGLSEGRLIALAPEGRQSLIGGLEEGTHGAAYLALKSDAVVLPVTFTGTENLIVYHNMRRLRRTHVTFTVGPTFRLTRNTDRRKALQISTDEIMQTLADQLPPQYQGVYSSASEQTHADG